MFASPDLKSRIAGCLLGGALGDAWGSASEGRTGPISFHVPERSALSDDTELTLATCEAIIESGRVEPANVASHLVRWSRAGRIHGMGSSTFKAMRDLAAGTHWAPSGARGEYAAGSGGAMRIAPLAFLLDPINPDHRVIIRDVCRITHHSDEAYVGALAVLLAIHSVVAGSWSPQTTFIALTRDNLPDSAVRDRIGQLVQAQLPASDVASRFGATGHVVDAVPLGLYCAQSIASNNLADVLAMTITCGGDTDTIASIAGQLAGTVVGVAGVPSDLVAAIQGADNVVAAAHQFANFVCNRSRQP